MKIATLSAAQARALWEMCVLSTYGDDFIMSKDMIAVAKLIADRGGSAFDRLRCLTHAADQERRELAEPARRAA